ncbi:hypothetical protein C1645_850025 [Glomus cerebriforme]|uniref:HMG box domain-containing protein n=1 Tax=Glomus cerebriforme TaxID=658196 RepID=A0A397TNV9_9GLOM|nr:hypothetical protein C1645_850025 [Glomus cerebriforme]
MTKLEPTYNISSIKSFSSDFESQIDPEILLKSFLSQTPPPYQLTIPLDKLLNTYPKSDGTIPRPKNSFILFRNDFNEKIKKHYFLNMKVGEFSIIVGQEWKNQPPSVLQFFQVLSLVSRQRHKTMYPNYKYKPQKKGKKSKISHTSLILPTPSRDESAAYQEFSALDDEHTILIDKVLGIL